MTKLLPPSSRLLFVKELVPKQEGRDRAATQSNLDNVDQDDWEGDCGPPSKQRTSKFEHGAFL